MKKQIKYTKGEIGKYRVIDDFLPAPKDLILKEDSVRVMVSLKKDSIDFFKSQASKHHISYQKIIKELLDTYAHQHK